MIEQAPSEQHGDGHHLHHGFPLGQGRNLERAGLMAEKFAQARDEYLAQQDRDDRDQGPSGDAMDAEDHGERDHHHGLVRDRVEHGAKTADLVPCPGKVAIDVIGERGEQKDRHRRPIREGAGQDQKDQRDHRCRDHAGDSQDIWQGPLHRGWVARMRLRRKGGVSRARGNDRRSFAPKPRSRHPRP